MDYLNSIGRPSGFNSRTTLAKSLGITDYTGTETQNTRILDALRSGTPVSSSISNTPATTSYVQGSMSVPMSVPQTTTTTFATPTTPTYTTNTTPKYTQAVQTTQNNAQSFDPLLQSAIDQKKLPSDFASLKQMAESNGMTYDGSPTSQKALGYFIWNGVAMPGYTSATQQTQQQQGTQTDPQQQLLDQMFAYLQKLEAAGKALNPNIQITPEQTAAFMAQASNEIDPYYATQLKIAKDQLLTSLGYTQDQIAMQETQAQKQYNENLRQIGSTAADQGFAQSGIRQRQEQNLASDTQYQLSQARKAAALSAGNAAGQFAQQFGGANLPTAPGLNSMPRIVPGSEGFKYVGESAPLYQLSPGVYDGLTGSNQYEQNVAKRTRASELESAFRTNSALSQARTLNL